ncbi:multidrug DMT transporter permease [Thermoplasmatales archaeon SG8-52-4]|nr:MAG: multidrug DMT transporter permease [Thermoplasmatales archaeon SG8-52-4]
MDNKKNKATIKNFSELKFIFMMIVAIISWAFAFPFIKIGLRELSFINLTIMRFFIVCCIFSLIFIFQKKRFSKLQKKDIIPIFIIGFLGVMVYHIGLNYGEQFVSPGAASLIIATIPIQIVILAYIFLKEKIGFIKFIGIVIALSGVLIISVWGKKDASLEVEYIYGIIAIIIAAVMGAIYTITGKKLLDRYSGLSLTVYAIILGSIGLIPFISFSLFEQVSQMSVYGWFAILFLGIFSTVIGYVIWYVALRIKTASEISVYLYAVPVLSTIISYFIFKDEITLMFVLGGALVIIGLIVAHNKKEKIKEKID